MFLVGAIVLLGVSVPYLVSRRWRVLIRDAARSVNGPKSGWLRAVTMTNLMIFSLGIVALWIWLVPDPAGFQVVILDALALVTVVFLMLMYSLVFFNWPRFLAPKDLRHDTGAAFVFFRRQRRPTSKRPRG
jgi:hypothetical protein